jgi:7-carboxy-7-deazaguanine synthase
VRLSEVYTSVQGEGPGAGSMTQFIRFAGCNLRCPGWPCDTQHAIDPDKYRHEWQTVDVGTIMDLVQPYPRRVVFTGGEPHLQPKDELATLANKLYAQGYQIEIFSNGTLPFPEWAPRLARTIMDWKLKSSGEDPYNQNRINNLRLLDQSDAVKFVIGNAEDFDQAVELWEEHIWNPQLKVQTYYGVVWGKLETAELVEWIQERRLDWKLNVQVHNYIWDRDKRGI